MRSRLSILVILSAGGLLAGCWDGEGRITAASLREFWRRAGAGPLVPGGMGPRRRPAASEAGPPPHGTLRAMRRGSIVVVEVALAGLPEDVKVIATGLRLGDGRTVHPKTVLAGAPAGAQLSEAPRIAFGFDGGRPAGMAGAAERSFQVSYELAGPGRSAEGSVFTLVLGEPETPQACQLGITLGVSTRDGGPAVCECVRLPDGPGELGRPFLPLPTRAAPSVSFVFREAPPEQCRGPGVWILAEIASGHAPPRRPAVAVRAHGS